MKDEHKTKAILMKELRLLREEVVELQGKFKTSVQEKMGETTIYDQEFDSRLENLKRTNTELLAQIDERIKTEQLLKESKEKYRNLLELVIDGICIVQDFRMKFCNFELAEMLGYKSEKIIGSRFDKFIFPEDLPRIFEFHRRHIKGEKDMGLVEARILGKSGITIWTEMNASIINYEGNPAQLVVVRNISDKIEARWALERSEKKYRTLIENQGEGVCTIDEQDHFTLVNPAAEKILGVSSGEMIGRSISEFLDEKPLAYFQEQKEKQRQGHQSTYDLKLTNAKGDVRQLIVTATPNLDNKGEFVGIFTIFRDITERQRAQEALRSSEARFRMLADTTTAAIFIHRGNCLRYVNRTAVTMTGYSKDELLDMDFLEIIHQDWQQLAQKRGLSRLQGEKVPERYELQILTKQGVIKWVDFTAGIMEFEGQTSVLGTCFDITDHKVAEQALQESEERYRRLTENAPDMIWRSDLQGKLKYINSVAKKATGYSPAEVINMDPEKYLTPKSRKDVRRWIKKALAFEPSVDFYSGEVEYYHKDGHLVPCDLKVTMVRDENGKVVYLEGISRDITDRKKAEEEKARLEKHLMQAQKMESIGTLAGGIAHDFNNSLQIILCSVNLVEEAGLNRQVFSENIQVIRKATQQMSKWTTDLLAYSRGSFSLKRPLDMNECIEKAVSIISHNLTGRINITWEPDPTPPWIEVSPGEIEQVVVNLLINASEAITKRGDIHIQSQLTNTAPFELENGFAPEKFVRLTVKDNGCGMDTEAAERIFEPFFSTKFIGRGMGMAVVFGIVKSNNGRIFVRSKPGKGTTIDVYFPAIKAPAIQNTLSVPKILEKRQYTKILLVDDETDLVNVVARTLKHNGYEVVTASNGLEAADSARENMNVDIVIMDVIMPEVDGLQAYLNIKKHLPNARFIAISGYDEKGPVQDVMDAGADLFIQKPFEIPTLLQILKEI